MPVHAAQGVAAADEPKAHISAAAEVPERPPLTGADRTALDLAYGV